MRACAVALSFVTCLAMTSAVAQTAGYVKSVNQCLRDSIGYPVSQQTKTMYCTCMVDKMSESETRSVTQWERVNPLARDVCARRAGWD